MWKDRLGIDVIIKSLPTPEMNKLRDARDFDIVAQTMFVMVGDPDELASFFTTGSSSNFADYSNPRVDELLAAQSIEPDPAKRRAMVNEVEKTLLADAPFIPTGYNAYAVGWYDYVHGFMPLYSTYASQLAYEQVWLDK
jgi:ABC-type oligopeptide transport system substrate-binding subunit